MEMAFPVPVDGAIQYDWVAKGGVRREGITLS